MKQVLVNLLLTALIACFSLGLQAQSCESFIMFKKGATYELENYNAKDKKQGRVSYVVRDVVNKGGKLEATIHYENYDEKDKKQSEGEMKMTCDGEKLEIDMSDAFKSMQNGANEDKEMVISGNMLEFPKKLAVGQDLPDMKSKMLFLDKKTKAEFMNIKLETTKRKVEAKETITTAAGTFECFKISYETLNQPMMSMVAMRLPSFVMKGYMYYAEGVGMVKTVMLDRKGEEVKAYSILTKFTK